MSPFLQLPNTHSPKPRNPIHASNRLTPHSYISADYERRTFTVSQCDWSPTSQKQNILPITSASTPLSPAPSSTPPPSKPSAGAIAGGAIGGIAFLALLATGGYFLYTKILRPRSTRHKKDTVKAELDSSGERRPELDGKDGAQELGGEAKGYYGAEVEGVGSPGAELDAGFGRAVEMPAREAAVELP